MIASCLEYFQRSCRMGRWVSALEEIIVLSIGTLRAVTKKHLLENLGKTMSGDKKDVKLEIKLKFFSGVLQSQETWLGFSLYWFLIFPAFVYSIWKMHFVSGIGTWKTKFCLGARLLSSKLLTDSWITLVIEMLFYIPRVSNISVSLNWDWFIYHIFCKYFEFCLSFPSLQLKKIKSVDYIKGKLRDNLKVFCSLFVFDLWLLVCGFLWTVILNQNFLVLWLLSLEKKEKTERCLGIKC